MVRTNRQRREEGHTPGPWTQEDFGLDAITGRPGTTIHGADGGRVAELLQTERARDEHLANAALIAAAPELLEALKGMMVVAGQHFDCSSLCCVEKIAAARVALAKAEGK